MIKSISYWSLPGRLSGACPIEKALGLAQQTGFDGLELCVGVEGVLVPTTSQAECGRIRQLIDKSGLAVPTLASGMSWAFNPASNDATTRQRAIELHADALQRAAWLGCQALLFVPGVVTSPIAPEEKVPYELAVERVHNAVTQLLETAERVNVDLCLENVWNGLFLSPLELASFIDSFQSPNLGVYFDVGNLMRYHQYPPHWIEYLGERIKRVHVKGYAEDFEAGSYSFCDLGAGDVPWKESIAALQSCGYRKTLVAEMLPYRPGLLEHTSAALDDILNLLSTAVADAQHRLDEKHVGIAERSATSASRKASFETDRT